MDLVGMWESALPVVTAVAIKVGAAFILYMVGRWLISFAVHGLSRILSARRFDPTLQRYIGNILSVVLNVLLIVAILGYFGLQTTSFAALLAGVGIAVGAAWSGLLGNFAAGAFLIIFRPYKVGDYVVAGGVEGTVVEIGMFNTVINTPDNVVAVVGNSKVSNDVIRNFSTNPYRRVEQQAKLPAGADPLAAIKRLKPALAAIPNVLADPPPTVEILDFSDGGTLLCVRPHCHQDHYWQVFFDTNKVIASTLRTAGAAST